MSADIHAHLLKQRTLEIAQWLAPGEAMTQTDAGSSLTVLVTRVAAHPSTTATQMALIAVGLAEHIEAQHVR